MGYWKLRSLYHQRSNKVGIMSNPILYFEETFKKEKKFRYCLRFVNISDGEEAEPEPIKQNSALSLNLKSQANKVSLVESEKRILRDHLDFVIRKLEKLHKNLIWNVNLGHVPIVVNEMPPRTDGEINISVLPERFDVKNPRTWSKSTLETMDSNLKELEFDADGIVSVFALEENDKLKAGVFAEEVRSIGLDHLEKVCGQRVWRQKVARRQTVRKSPVGGQVVFLAYKLISSVTTGQILSETLLQGVDLAAKKTELCHHLESLGFTSYTEDRLRRQVELLPLSLTRDQARLYQSLIKLRGGGASWQGQKMVNITLVNYCQRKLSSVSRRECLCYSKDK